MVVVTDILEIEDNYKGKNNHFLLRLDNETIHMKCDDKAFKDKWVTSLKGLLAIYQGKKVLDWEDDRRSHKEELDIRILYAIMDEQESRKSLIIRRMG